MTAKTSSPQERRSAVLIGCVTGLFLLFLVEIVCGLLLELRYRPLATTAYADVHAIQASGFFLVRAIHYWSSGLLIVGSFLCLVWMVLARWLDPDVEKTGHVRRKFWLATALLFLTSLLAQMSGNLLPFDHHGVQTAVIESGVAHGAPVFGKLAANAMLGGPQFNDSTLARWHFGHLGLSLLGVTALLLFWRAGRSESRNKVAVGLPLLFVVLAAALSPAPLGNPASAVDYTLFDAQVSWYTWPLHGSLNLFSRLNPSLGWIGSMVVPSLFVLLIATAPWLVRRSRPLVTGAFFGFIGYFFLAATFFGGRFAPLVGNRDPLLAQVARTTVKGPVDQAMIAKGRTLFNLEACSGCHGVDGRGGSGGPDLYGVAARRGTNLKWYIDFISDPQEMKPNTMMPSFPDLTVEQKRAIAEFLIHRNPPKG